MIKPTPGRVVWFTPSTTSARPGFIAPTNGDPCAAIVAYVHSDLMVNLAVFDANGVFHSVTSVTLVQEGDTRPEGGFFAEWMPYQKGQAAKHSDYAKAAIAAGATGVTVANGIGWAVKQMHGGSRVRRAGWNGKGMWLELQVPDAHSKMTLPYVFMFTAQGDRVPWLCSQTDLLASDWQIAD